MATAAMVDGGAVRSLPPQPPLLSPRFTDAVTTTGLYARISLPSSAGSRPTANRQQPAEQQLVEQQPADHSLPTDSSPPTSS